MHSLRRFCAVALARTSQASFLLVEQVPRARVRCRSGPGTPRIQIVDWTVEVSGSVALLEALIVEGVDTIFGYPGGAIMPIYDALFDYNDNFEQELMYNNVNDSTTEIR